MSRRWRSHLQRTLSLVALSLLLTSSSSAYYFYIHFKGTSPPFTPIVEKFDLNALNNNTVPFFISDQGASAYVPGDSFQAVVSEIRTAASIWNGVSSSSLRLGYGGLYTTGTQENAPGIHIDFSSDVPPGLLAISGPESTSSLATDSNGQQFIPILQSRMLLRSDLSTLPGPSYSELFFTTVVHEFGHTLGLQHTLTSSVMSTAITSSSTKAAPLGPDDIAGVSELYPTSSYAGTTGSITGKVTLNNNGKGVNLASVVAISTSNPAISALTNPDGTFEIDGLPPMQYFLYVHPLPPAQLGESYPANVVPPTDLSTGKPIVAGPNFVTQFYPGTQNFSAAQFVFVNAGQVTQNINFSVQPEAASAISSIRVYGYSSDSIPLTAPELFVGVPAALAAGGTTGLLENGNLAPGLTIGLLGTSAEVYDWQPYYQDYVSFDIYATNTAAPGPKHLLFSTPSDIYVLPSAFTIASSQPPAVTALSASFDQNGNRIVLVGGTNFQPTTQIFFDGLPGQITGTDNNGNFIVVPPPAPGSYAATVVAVNTSDNQSSLFLQGWEPPVYVYDPAGTPVITASPATLNVGADTTVDIVTQNTNFIDGQVSVGFGTSDVQVKSVTVLSPTHLSVVANAPVGTEIQTSSLNITNGLQLLSQSLGFSIQPEASSNNQ